MHPGRHALAAYPFERLIEGCLSHEQPSLFWEQLLGYRVYGLAASPSRGAAETNHLLGLSFSSLAALFFGTNWLAASPTPKGAARHVFTSALSHVHWLPPPGPATFDLKHQRPTQEGAYQDQSGEKAEAGESNLDRYGFYYVGSNQDFEAEQQRGERVMKGGIKNVGRALVDRAASRIAAHLSTSFDPRTTPVTKISQLQLWHHYRAQNGAGHSPKLVVFLNSRKMG